MHIMLLQNQIHSFVANSAKYSHLRKKRCKYGKMLELVGQSEKKANENATISKSSDFSQSMRITESTLWTFLAGRFINICAELDQLAKETFCQLLMY